MAPIEVRVLRTFVPREVRDCMCGRLLAKYRRGDRSASDVADAVAALESQNLLPESDALLLSAVHAVSPVPTVLWTRACARIPRLSTFKLRGLLAIARESPRCRKHLPASLVLSRNGAMAALHEASSHRSAWSMDLLERAVQHLKTGELEPSGDRDQITRWPRTVI